MRVLFCLFNFCVFSTLLFRSLILLPKMFMKINTNNVTLLQKALEHEIEKDVENGRVVSYFAK